MKQAIKDLIEQYLEIIESPRNVQNKVFWERTNGWNRDLLRATPKTVNGKVPFVIALDNSLWSHVLNVDLRDFYNDPEVFLETQLKMKIYHFNNFDDNFYFTNELYIWFSVITELSLFGSSIEYHAQKEPWYQGHLLQDYDDLRKLEEPDFYKSGVMPKVHKFYEVLGEYAQGKLNVMFPEWVRSPYCMAVHLRGMEDLMMDFLLEPEFVHQLMARIVTINKKWNADRDKHLNIKNNSCKLWNDEVGSPMISPEIYRDFIFPYEKELSNYYGEVAYWHSCGDTDKFMEQINQLTNLRMFNSGPWTSFEKAAKVFGQKTALDICINPELDVYDASRDDIIKKLGSIRQSCVGTQYAIRADAFMLKGDLTTSLKKIGDWNKVAKEILSE